MAMPRNLILTRHGESEHNAAKHLSEKGDHRMFTKKFKRRHSSTFRLTDKGRAQAEKAGEWIRKNIGLSFDRYYVSEYLRAMETAALLGLPAAEWLLEFYLRERDWGVMDVVSEEEKMAKYKEELARHTRDGFYWRPTRGESMAELCIRVDRVLNTLHRECDGKDVIIVCHGEVMWAFRVRLERLSQREYAQLDASTHKHDQILNCQILHYTRTNPISDPGSDKLAPHFEWMRSVCPTDLSLSRNIWTPIRERKKYRNGELLKIAEETERMIK